jgi:hypothetical protein
LARPFVGARNGIPLILATAIAILLTVKPARAAFASR